MAQRISVRPRPEGGESAPIIKWRDVPAGTEIKATYNGMRQGKFGPLADLAGAKGAVTVPVPTALLTQLSRVRRGAEVFITYNGKKDSQTAGRTYHDFQVDVTNEADLLPEGAEAQVAPGQGYDRQIKGSESGGFSPARQSRPIKTAQATMSALAVLGGDASGPEAEAGERSARSSAESDATDEAPAPAPTKPAGKGRTLKSVFAGLD